jgi:hypothetical protein
MREAMNKRAIEMKILSSAKRKREREKKYANQSPFIHYRATTREQAEEREYSSNEFKWSRQRCLLDVAIYGRVH